MLTCRLHHIDHSELGSRLSTSGAYVSGSGKAQSIGTCLLAGGEGANRRIKILALNG
jgi:hypothetical protein